MLLVYGVNPVFDRKIIEIFPELDYISKEIFGREAIITSGNDKGHMKNSLHYKWKAIDLRIVDIPEKHKWTQYAAEIRRRLSKDYDVILEKDHVHIEYDPK